ncbi:hypothetical protein WJX81_004810 [Elliptochloris bilobata]|uniref:DNA-directed primase/polymerase protein n=1 Tax=Elliptochloris bilobata TaxID=381761 RepID=A0AAW1SE66_9CHLO
MSEVERYVLRLLGAAQRRRDAADLLPYQVFARQEAAFCWADAHPLAAELRVFSAERSGGSRTFSVATPAEFWRRYCDVLPQHRHFYEIIRQGAPCHLYFDLEFQREHNEGVDGAALTAMLLRLVAQGLQARFGLALAPEWVVELDSSTPAKFSRHLVVRVPGAAFASNFHVGAFVKSLVDPAAEASPGATALQGPAADASPGVRSQVDPTADASSKPAAGFEEPCRADGGALGGEGLSTGAGGLCGGGLGDSVLTIGGCGDRRALCGGGAMELPLHEQLLVAKDASGARTLFVDTGVYTRNRAFRLYLSSKAGKDALLLPTERFWCGAALRSRRDVFAAALVLAEPGGGSGGAVPQPQTGASPYPGAAAFIESVCTQGGVQGRVRSWVVWPEAGLLLLNMRDNRWCANVGRFHASNGIFYVVDLQAGVWFQKCYDIDCRGFRTEAMPLPPGALDPLDTASAAQSAVRTGAREGHVFSASGQAIGVQPPGTPSACTVAWSEGDAEQEAEMVAAAEAAEGARVAGLGGC